jgi:hypothetical protein
MTIKTDVLRTLQPRLVPKEVVLVALESWPPGEPPAVFDDGAPVPFETASGQIVGGGGMGLAWLVRVPDYEPPAIRRSVVLPVTVAGAWQEEDDRLRAEWLAAQPVAENKGLLSAFIALKERSVREQDFLSFAQRYGVPTICTRSKEYPDLGWEALDEMRRLARVADAILSLASALRKREAGDTEGWATLLKVSTTDIAGPGGWKRKGGDWWNHVPDETRWYCGSREDFLERMLNWHFLERFGPEPMFEWKRGQRPRLRWVSSRSSVDGGLYEEVAMQLTERVLGGVREPVMRSQVCAADDCLTEFTPLHGRSRPQIYCSKECNNRMSSKRYRARQREARVDD